MAEIKISDLTPKGANLIATDLLVVSEDIGGGLYETKSITGDEVLNAVAKTAVAVRNTTGATIYKGTIVYISGTSGGKALISKAQANSEATSSKTLGVVTADIANNANGNVLTNGLLTLLDTRTTATNPFTTDTLVIGDDLYLSPTTAGYVTNVKPIAPNNLVNIGKVLETSATTGQILYAIVNGYELGELHDVDTTGAISGDVLALNGGIWKPTAIARGITIGTTPITSGVAGRVLFEGVGNVVQESAGLTYNDTTRIFSLIGSIGSVIQHTPLTNYVGFGGFQLNVANGTERAFSKLNPDSGEFKIGTTGSGYFTTIHSGGVERVRVFSANGNIGINTTTDQGGKLQIKAPGALSTDIALRVRNSADTADLAIINGLGNVGIGTTTPNGSKLQVQSTITNGVGTEAIRAYGSTNYIGMHYDEGRAGVFTTNYIGVGGNSPGSFGFYTSAGTQLASIGTGGLFSYNVNGKIANGNNIGYINLWNGSSGNMELVNTGNYSMTFSTNNIERGRFTNTGNFGIGTTTPTAKLYVAAQGALSTDIAFRVRNSADTSNLFMVKGNGVLNAANLPTSATELVAGDIWNNLGILTIV